MSIRAVFAMSVSLIALSVPAIALSADINKNAVPGLATTLPPAASDAMSPNAGPSELLAVAAPVDIDVTPASTGARLLDLGQAHGLRTVSARSGDQFMILQIATDGQAVVGGPQLDLPVDKLLTMASGQVKELGEAHGLRGLYLRNGSEFQVLYATPDGKATIAGVMWDANGKNLTREQVSKIDGAIPTMVVDKDGSKALETPAKPNSLLGVEQAAFGTYGDPAAPRLWMIFDPYCSYSVRAFDALKGYVKAGRIQLAIVPISILDYETNGQSTPAAESLLSQDSVRMAEALGSPELSDSTLAGRSAALAEQQCNRRTDRAQGDAHAHLAEGGRKHRRAGWRSQELGHVDR